MDTSNILTLAGLILAIIPFIFILIKCIKEKKAPFTGIWEDEIYYYNFDDKPVKRDIFYLKQKGNVITGTAKRIFPENQNKRRYEIQGRKIGKDFVAFFWATNETALSYGCWFITQVNDTTFDGYYLRIQKNSEESPIIHVKLIKSNKSVKYFKAIE